MFAKALVAFLVLPGAVAGVFPALIYMLDPWREGGHWLGLEIAILGIFFLLWCVRDFYVSGKGTLAPWSPPQNMVTVGLYRLVRNPMYISVLTILLGWSILSGSAIHAVYSVLIATMFHFRVTGHEEPWLSEEFGVQWENYSRAVNRWLPRIKPWYQNGNDT